MYHLVLSTSAVAGENITEERPLPPSARCSWGRHLSWVGSRMKWVAEQSARRSQGHHLRRVGSRMRWVAEQRMWTSEELLRQTLSIAQEVDGAS